MLKSNINTPPEKSKINDLSIVYCGKDGYTPR
jgi:hypothetical protein